MIIDLTSIPHGTRRFDFCLEKYWWHSDGPNNQVLGLDTPLRVRIDIYRAGDRCVLEGDLSGGLQIICDRCLEAYHQDIKSSFRVFLVSPISDTAKADIELLEEDMEESFIRGTEVNLDAIIQEQVYLTLPVKSLCSKECLGLCPLCGGNLNEKDCQCRQAHGHPAFQKLKDL